jgi:hypothetical protein
MTIRRWFVVMGLVGAFALAGAGCGGSDSDDSSSESSSTTVEAEDDKASADLDPETVDPCLLEPAEIQALIAANPDALGPPFGDSLGAGVRDPESPNECKYAWTTTDPGMPPSYFSLVVYAPRDGCLVEHRGVCVLPSTTYGDTPITVPPEVQQAVKERIDAQ